MNLCHDILIVKESCTLFSVSKGSVPILSQIQSTLDTFRNRYRFPGATAAVAMPCGTVVTVATGLADIEADRAMTIETPMLAASIGKTFVGATVLALESNALLARTHLLSDHLGDRTWFNTLPNANSITIDHLLRHEAGLPDHPQLPAFQVKTAARFSISEPVYTPIEILDFIAGAAPLFESGRGWAYSDTGYILLGLVIEQVTGQTYYEVIQQKFLRPLGLNFTVPSNQRDLFNLAVGYTSPRNPFKLPKRTADASGKLLWDPGVEWTGGGLASTSHDLAQWGHALFNGTAIDTPYLDRLLDGVTTSPESLYVGYGAGVAIYAKTAHGPSYGHGGVIPGYVSSLRHYADHNLTIAFQINTDAKAVSNGNALVPALEAALADLVLSALP